jgi:hypothetical protein
MLCPRARLRRFKVRSSPPLTLSNRTDRGDNHVDRRVGQIHVLLSSPQLIPLCDSYRQIQAPNKDEVMDADATMQEAQPAEATATAAATPRKRPRLDLTIEPRERKRGKSMFGLLVGTLNKAKTEDEARNASEAVRAYT